MLAFAVVFITMALVFYTVGVWAEKIGGRLKVWHAVVFWLGFVCDTIGTGTMSRIAGGFVLNFHGLSGMLAIVLMLVHAIWATIVLARKDEAMILKFHRFSVFVWAVWLIPMASGMAMGMLGGR
jgi:TIGR03987 family protein